MKKFMRTFIAVLTMVTLAISSTTTTAAAADLYFNNDVAFLHMNDGCCDDISCQFNMVDLVAAYSSLGYSVDIIWTTFDGAPRIYIVTPDGTLTNIYDEALSDDLVIFAGFFLQGFLESMESEGLNNTFEFSGVEARTNACCGVFRTRSVWAIAKQSKK